MSIIRILIGLLVAGLILAGELLAYRHFGFEAKWVPIVLFAILALAAGSLMHLVSHTKRLGRALPDSRRQPFA